MKISIITVTKNNKAGIVRAIESVRSQTYKNIEHIIVDGGSTDGSVEAIKNLEPDTADGLRIKNDVNNQASSRANARDLKISPVGRNDESQISNHYSLVSISEADNGIYDAINKGIKIATGDVIGLLHSDDFFADENVLSKVSNAFDKPFDSAQGDKVDAVYSDLVYVKSEKRGVRSDKNSPKSTEHSTFNIEHSVIRYWQTQKKEFTTETQRHGALKKGWMPPHPTLFIRKAVFEKYGMYRTDMKISADYEMILRLFYKYKISTNYLPITTYCMTLGGASNKSIGNIITKSREDYNAMKRYGLTIPIFTLLCKNLRKLPQFIVHKK